MLLDTISIAICFTSGYEMLCLNILLDLPFPRDYLGLGHLTLVFRIHEPYYVAKLVKTTPGSVACANFSELVLPGVSPVT